MIEFLRASVRPGITWFMALMFGLIIWFRPEAPERAWTIIETVILFWFIQRMAEKKA